QWCATDCAGNMTCHVQTIVRQTAPATGPQLQVINSDRHHLNVQLLASAEGRWNLEVYDAAGRKITDLFTQEMSQGQTHSFVLDCNGFKDTIYLFRWSNGSEQVIQKVVMMK
ncbi:MAG: Secretion system C-terminal sorting domain, partial [Bacteroidota bacterium]